MYKRALLLLALALALVAGCGPEPAAAPSPTAPRGLPGASGQESPLPTPAPTTAPAGQLETLKMALLPILDVLPFHVAEKNGYFAQEGIAVELVPVKSAQERDTLVQTGQVDGMVADLIPAVLFNQDEPQIMVVRTALQATPGVPCFRLLAKPGSDVSSPADLAGVEIAISQNTIIEYITDRMLQQAGLAADQIAVQEVSAIPVRFELLVNGEIPAATLPDPLASGAMAAGAVLVLDDTAVPEFSLSILALRLETLQARPEAVRGFLRAWEKAVADLNTSPQDYQDLLIQVGRVPESIQGSYRMPPFPAAGVPTPAQVADVVQWARDKGLLAGDVPYERLVDGSYLP